MTHRLVNIVNNVDPRSIRKDQNGRGDTVWIVPSFTLPDDVVMNGGFYPAEEIAKSYRTLEGTLAPIGHPFDEEGNYISAFDGEAINYFYGGATNRNVRRVADDKHGHRVSVEKHVNEKVAMQTERGLALLSALENGEPIHTSTGVLVEVVESEGVSPSGVEYQWIATNLQFDHDAILLNEEAAATPDDGVGMLVNHTLLQNVQHRGQTMAVNTVSGTEQKTSASDELKRLTENGMTFEQIAERLKATFENSEDALEALSKGDADNLPEELVDALRGMQPKQNSSDTILVSFLNAAKRLFSRGTATNSNQEEHPMFKEHIEKVLTEAKVDIVNMSDEQKLAAYEEQMKTNAKPEPKGEAVPAEQLQEVVNQAVADALKTNQAETEKQERDTIAQKLEANKVELSREDQDSMTINALRSFAKTTEPKRNSFGLPGQTAVNHDEFGETQMPNVED